MQTHLNKIVREIRQVSRARIAVCEIAHLLDSVDGRFVGIITSRFFKQVAAILTKEILNYSEKYSEVREEDLSAKEVVRKRRAEVRVSILEDIYYFELEMALLGKVTQEEWLRMRKDSKIVRGWQVWICHEKRKSGKASRTSKTATIGAH